MTVLCSRPTFCFFRDATLVCTVWKNFRGRPCIHLSGQFRRLEIVFAIFQANGSRRIRRRTGKATELQPPEARLLDGLYDEHRPLIFWTRKFSYNRPTDWRSLSLSLSPPHGRSPRGRTDHPDTNQIYPKWTRIINRDVIAGDAHSEESMISVVSMVRFFAVVVVWLTVVQTSSVAGAYQQTGFYLLLLNF